MCIRDSANATRQFVREYDANEAEYDKKKLFDPRKFLKPGFEAITAAVEELSLIHI